MSFTDPAPGAQEGRTDQGVDWSGVRRIVAVAAGTITNVYQGLSGFGTTVVERLKGGQYIYYAEETSGVHTEVHAGQQVAQGQEIAGGGSGGVIEAGYWNPSTGSAMAAPGYQEGQVTSWGTKFRNMLSGKAAPSGGSGGGGQWWAVKVSLEASSSGTGWTELSSNGNGAGAAGKQQSPSCTGSSVGGCDFATLGKAYPHGTMLRIFNPSTNKTAVAPLTDVGNGSSFGPAIGITPALQSKLGGIQSGQTVHIQLASGQPMNVVSGFGSPVGGPSGSTAGSSGGSGKGKGRPGGGGTDTAAVDAVFTDYLALRDAPRTDPSPTPTAKENFAWWWAAFYAAANKVFSGMYSQNQQAVGQAVVDTQPQSPAPPAPPPAPQSQPQPSPSASAPAGTPPGAGHFASTPWAKVNWQYADGSYLIPPPSGYSPGFTG